MKVFKLRNDNTKTLSLDEKNELCETVSYEYIMRFENEEEYKNVESMLMDAVELGFEIYHSENRTSKLVYDHKCDKVFATRGVMISISSKDETKSSAIENLVKEVMIKNKEYLD